MGKCLMGKCFKQIYLTQTVLNNWIYPTPGPDRAHRHKQNCIYPQLFGFKPVLRTYAWHTTSSIIEYIPPPLGPTGPRDRKTKLHISTIVWLQISFLLIYFAHNILYNWIYPTSGPDRAHRLKQKCIYPRLFGLQFFLTYFVMYFAYNILYNCIYPTSGPDRAHRHMQKCTIVWPQL